VSEAVIARRRREREALLAKAREWAEEVGPALGAQAIVVVGSVARGDFNKWSDIDVLVVVDELADPALRRPPGVEVIVWPAAELARRRDKGTDPLAREA
jgi:predicted nucleotidyltransferase